MITQFNKSVVDSFVIPAKTVNRNVSFKKSGDWADDKAQEKDKSVADKGLYVMLTLNAVWLVAFLYFVLYVFT